MLHQIGLSAALGIGGFDPLGAIALVAAVIAGARKRAVLAFTAGAVGIGLISGTLMALGLGFVIGDVSRQLEKVTGAPWRHFLYGGFGIAVGLALVVWGVHLRRNGLDLGAFRKTFKGLSVPSMLVSGVVVGAGILTNPPFYLMILLAGRPDHVVGTVLLVAAFVLVAQSGMVIPTIALLMGLFTKLETWLSRVGKRVVPAIERAAPHLVIALAIVAGGFGVAELTGVIEL